VLGMSTLPYPDQKFPGFTSDPATHLQRVAQIVMAPLIKRAVNRIRGYTESNTP
jgi:hypothetical protein